MRIDRMLGITVMLLGRDRVTARELADRYEVSIRTVYRDIEAIQLAGIPVVSLSGNGGGYALMENYRIDRRLLTFEDMLAILTALKGAHSVLADPGLESAMDKISSLIPKDKVHDTQSHFERLVIDYQPWGQGQKQQERFRRIHEAIGGNRLLEMTYRNLRGETVTRVIEPMTLFFKGFSWYLFAYCRSKEDFRVFRLSRIISLNETGEAFERRAGSYRDMESEKSDVPPVHLIMRFAPEVRLRVEEQFDWDEISVMDNGFIQVTVAWPEDEWVYGTILSYGEHIEVIEPLHIRRNIGQKAQEMAKLHQT